MTAVVSCGALSRSLAGVGGAGRVDTCDIRGLRVPKGRLSSRCGRSDRSVALPDAWNVRHVDGRPWRRMQISDVFPWLCTRY
ncbi:hypothetical protein GCM10010345_91230 [Streptomyces canarius]|uniref:Uncharacterized protein n=1 Tax=Streptomyces canarius TaxID=285453 RepID=A0ABQ3DB51_9ACTN|nr:hypothetical protein GCM10010345_91230 [Streptomyces canarius]